MLHVVIDPAIAQALVFKIEIPRDLNAIFQSMFSKGLIGCLFLGWPGSGMQTRLVWLPEQEIESGLRDARSAFQPGSHNAIKLAISLEPGSGDATSEQIELKKTWYLYEQSNQTKSQMSQTTRAHATKR